MIDADGFRIAHDVFHVKAILYTFGTLMTVSVVSGNNCLLRTFINTFATFYTE